MRKLNLVSGRVEIVAHESGRHHEGISIVLRSIQIA